MTTATGQQDRQYWVDVVRRVALPVLEAGAAGKLHERMPIESQGDPNDRARYTRLEAIGRTLVGIAPWLELDASQCGDDAERQLQAKFRDLARQAVAHACNPNSPDYVNFREGFQPVVDAAFLCHAMYRAPRQLVAALSGETKRHLITELSHTRFIRAHFNNWLLFSAMVEVGLHLLGERFDPMHVSYAIRQHDQWYLGDGVYGDGPAFHFDYYNSFVIHPMLVDVARALHEVDDFVASREETYITRMLRYAAIQERLISPEGTYPPVGRSLAYRFGAFQVLAQVALMQALPEEISPAQVRCALTAVIRRSIESPGTFDEQGWLTVGFAGHQPGLGERYISTGSTYLCTAGLLPLGLPASDPFWSDSPADWTAKKAWAGVDLPCDHAIHE